MFHYSLLSKSITIPMNKVGGDIHALLVDKLMTFEGKCVEEGYVKPQSVNLFNYTCGKLKRNSVVVHAVFECEIANPVAGQKLTCIVEHNTKAGIKARVKGNSPYVVFLARDHHNRNPVFSKIKQNDTIHVKIIGQRYEIGDSKIYVIAVLDELGSIEESSETSDSSSDESESSDEEPQSPDTDSDEEPAADIEEPAADIEEPESLSDEEIPTKEQTKLDKQLLEKGVLNFFFKKKEGQCLSNFWNCIVKIQDEEVREYDSGECCFHGEKFIRIGKHSNGNRKKELLDYGKKFLKGKCDLNGNVVKKMGKQLVLTKEELKFWDSECINVQTEICNYKYDHYEEVRTELCKTKDKILIHPAMRVKEEKVKDLLWHGKGIVVKGKIKVLGKNMLGELWMKVRTKCI